MVWRMVGGMTFLVYTFCRHFPPFRSHRNNYCDEIGRKGQNRPKNTQMVVNSPVKTPRAT